MIEALGGRIDFVVRWQGGELDRLLNSRHSQLHESLAQMFESLADWQIAAEVSFNIRGERGVVDILAWHAATRTLLVIELKTDIVDMNEMLGTLDRKTRLAKTIARERGWFPERVAVWLVIAESSMNRRRVARHASVLRRAFPDDGRRVRGWLAAPEASFRGLSFWSNAASAGTKPGFATPRRVRLPKSRRKAQKSAARQPE